jgi:hypothetical protein
MGDLKTHSLRASIRKERNPRHYGLNVALLTCTRFDTCATVEAIRLNWRFSFSAADMAPPVLLTKRRVSIHDATAEAEHVGIKMNGAANCDDGANYCKCDGDFCTEEVTLQTDNFIMCNGQKTMTLTFNTTEHDTEYHQIVLTPLTSTRTSQSNKQVEQKLSVKARGIDLSVPVDRVFGMNSKKCSSYGDPHVNCFDERGSYVNKAPGLNWLVKSDDGFIKMQVRHFECGLNSYKCTVSFNTV